MTSSIFLPRRSFAWPDPSTHLMESTMLVFPEPFGPTIAVTPPSNRISFARPTEIRFEGGVTAIVGPNGSGKTNIVDSIKWVLGSGQAKDLRGKKMEEVIYAGGERRSRAAFAEVTVVFDNTSGRLPVD